ncbi:MAG: helix-turn-helix transcriptional regulator [Clostridia bacterium]|nr:helix-turn-helix transcriptional regulator [Clostridia bacterium]
MTDKTMGEIISTLRKEKGMTQKELAEKLNITDKAVSKWERDVACPDINTLPKLAEILGISLDELMNTKAKPILKNSKVQEIVNLVLKSVPVAAGVAVCVTSILNEIDIKSGFIMTGIGLACIGISMLNKDK